MVRRLRLAALLAVLAALGLVVVAGASAATSFRMYATSETTNDSQSSTWTYGSQFRVDAASVEITAVQVFKHSGEPVAEHTVKLWDAGGTVLATATASLSTGWNEVPLSSPVALTNGSTYTVSYVVTNVVARTTAVWPRSIGSIGTGLRAVSETSGSAIPTNENTGRDNMIGPVLDVISAPPPTTTTTATTTVSAPYAGPTAADFAAATTQQHNDAVAAQQSAADAKDRLDLAWWGMWAGVGVLLALLVVPRVFAKFKFGQDF